MNVWMGKSWRFNRGPFSVDSNVWVVEPIYISTFSHSYQYHWGEITHIPMIFSHSINYYITYKKSINSRKILYEHNQFSIFFVPQHFWRSLPSLEEGELRWSRGRQLCPVRSGERGNGGAGDPSRKSWEKRQKWWWMVMQIGGNRDLTIRQIVIELFEHGDLAIEDGDFEHQRWWLKWFLSGILWEKHQHSLDFFHETLGHNDLM